MERPDDRFPNRRNPRLRHYDYSQPGYYFVTICTRDKKCIFGTSERLNHYGECAAEGFQEIGKHFPGVRVDKYVVMPNHVHGIIVLPGNNASLSVIIGQYKGFVTRRLRTFDRNMDVWQPSFHDHVIRSGQDYQRIWSYIDANPIRWSEDCFYEEPLP